MSDETYVANCQLHSNQILMKTAIVNWCQLNVLTDLQTIFCTLETWIVQDPGLSFKSTNTDKCKVCKEPRYHMAIF